MYNGPMGAAEGYNGVTQGSVGASRGGSGGLLSSGSGGPVNPTSSLNPTAGAGNVLDAATLMAVKAIVPALQLGGSGDEQEAQQGRTASTNTTQGSPHKQLGQQQQSSTPRSNGGPGVSAVGPQGNNLAVGGTALGQLIRGLLGI